MTPVEFLGLQKIIAAARKSYQSSLLKISPVVSDASINLAFVDGLSRSHRNRNAQAPLNASLKDFLKTASAASAMHQAPPITLCDGCSDNSTGDSTSFPGSDNSSDTGTATGTRTESAPPAPVNFEDFPVETQDQAQQVLNGSIILPDTVQPIYDDAVAAIQGGAAASIDAFSSRASAAVMVAIAGFAGTSPLGAAIAALAYIVIAEFADQLANWVISVTGI